MLGQTARVSARSTCRFTSRDWDRFLRPAEATHEAVRYVHDSSVRLALMVEAWMYGFSSATDPGAR